MSTLEYVINSLLVKPDTGKVDPLALNFLSCFAICDSSKVKNFYVMELKSAIGRILALPESIQKHYHLRALLDLISTSIEHVSAQMSRHAGLPPGANLPMQKELNTISALMVKRGLAQDLARLPHSLDLSSPYLATTLNGLLKPLETLSKVAGFSQPGAKERKKEKKSESNADQSFPIEDDMEVDDDVLTQDSQENTDCEQNDMEEEEESHSMEPQTFQAGDGSNPVEIDEILREVEVAAAEAEAEENPISDKGSQLFDVRFML